MVESALIYTYVAVYLVPFGSVELINISVCLLITHVSYLAKAPFQFIALDAVSQAVSFPKSTINQLVRLVQRL